MEIVQANKVVILVHNALFSSSSLTMALKPIVSHQPIISVGSYQAIG
jgi:hypothetical protein